MTLGWALCVVSERAACAATLRIIWPTKYVISLGIAEQRGSLRPNPRQHVHWGANRFQKTVLTPGFGIPVLSAALENHVSCRQCSGSLGLIGKTLE